MAPQDDLTAERAAELCFKLALLVDTGTHLEVDTEAMEAIAQALKIARQGTLREAANVALTYMSHARQQNFSGVYTAELIAQALDRLASEGG